MKVIIILATLAATTLAIPADTYDPEYDNFNAEELVESVRLLTNYAKCFLGIGPCTSDGLKFRKIIPEALHTSCRKCSPKQRQLIRTVANGYKTKLPNLWEELVEHEDPEGIYREDIEKFLNSSE